MFLAQVSPAEATPKFAIGVQLEPLKLSALLPASLVIPEQFDLDIVTQQPSCGDDQTGPDDSGFGFVFNKWPGLDPDDPALPGSVRDWFAPLFGGAPDRPTPSTTTSLPLERSRCQTAWPNSCAASASARTCC